VFPDPSSLSIPIWRIPTWLHVLFRWQMN